MEEMPRGMMWRVYSSKTKKTRKIPVRPEVAKLTRELMKTAPRGSGLPIFRTTTGRAWSKVNGVIRFIEARRKLGWETDPFRKKYSSYTCRHTFAQATAHPHDQHVALSIGEPEPASSGGTISPSDLTRAGVDLVYGHSSHHVQGPKRAVWKQ